MVTIENVLFVDLNCLEKNLFETSKKIETYFGQFPSPPIADPSIVIFCSLETN